MLFRIAYTLLVMVPPETPSTYLSCCHLTVYHGDRCKQVVGIHYFTYKSALKIFGCTFRTQSRCFSGVVKESTVHAVFIFVKFHIPKFVHKSGTACDNIYFGAYPPQLNKQEVLFRLGLPSSLGNINSDLLYLRNHFTFIIYNNGLRNILIVQCLRILTF